MNGSRSGHRDANDRSSVHSRDDYIRIDPRDGYTVLTLEKSKALGKKLGFCYICGQKTHAIGLFGKRTGLNNATVLRGKCLICAPDAATSTSIHHHSGSNTPPSSNESVATKSTKSSGSSELSSSTESSPTRSPLTTAAVRVSRPCPEQLSHSPTTPVVTPPRPKSEPIKTPNHSPSTPPHITYLPRSGRSREWQTSRLPRSSVKSEQTNNDQTCTPEGGDMNQPPNHNTPQNSPTPMKRGYYNKTKLGTKKINHSPLKATKPGVVHVVEDTSMPQHRVSFDNTTGKKLFPTLPEDEPENDAGAMNIQSKRQSCSLKDSFSIPDPPELRVATTIHEPSFFNTTSSPGKTGQQHNSFSDPAPNPIDSLLTTIQENLRDALTVQEACKSLRSLCPSKGSDFQSKNISITKVFQTLLSAMQFHGGNAGLMLNPRIQIDSLDILERVTSTKEPECTQFGQEILHVVTSVMNASSVSSSSSDERHSMRLNKKATSVLLNLLRNPSNKYKTIRDENVQAITNAMKINESVPSVQEKGCSILGLLSEKSEQQHTRDVLVANNAVSAITNAMANEPNNTGLQSSSCVTLSRLCSSQLFSEVMTGGGNNNKGILTIVGAMMKNSHVLTIQQYGCKIISRISSDERSQVKQGIINSRGIDAIVSAMFKYPRDHAVQQAGCAALSGLCFSNEARDAIVSNSGIVAVVEAMIKNDDSIKVQGDGCFILAFLSEGGLEVKFAIDSTGALAIIQKAMKKYPNDSRVQLYGCRALSLLSDL